MLTMKKILIPIDFSEYSKDALSYAVEFNRSFAAHILLIYVVEPVIYPADFSFGQVALPSMELELRERGQTQLDTLIKNEIPGDMSASGIVRSGKPFVEIIKTAREEAVDLIIIATHGHTGIEHILFGSTAEKVIRKSPCPVLSIRSSNQEFVMP